MPQLLVLLFGLLRISMPNAHPLPPAINATFSSRQDLFCTIIARDSERVLLQSNGNVDDVVDFLVCPSETETQFLYETMSSSPDVLPIDSEHVSVNVIQSEITTCLNVSILLVFDKVVGTSAFTLSVVDPGSSETICDSTISYTIAGMSFFEISSTSVAKRSEVTALQDTKIVYSGDDNEILSDYRDVLEKRWRSLQFHVQYPDGTSSSTLPISDLISSLQTIQVTSESDESSPVQFDTKCPNIATTSDRSADCGAGFTIGDDRKLITYDLQYKPFKDGITKMIFLWPSFIENHEALSGDQYETSLLISVIGDPPPIIENYEPRRSFWRSGGETITVTYDNVGTSRERHLKVGNLDFQEVYGSYRLLKNGLYAAEYRTAIGSGVDLNFNLEIILEDGSAVQSAVVHEGVRFSYTTKPLSIDEIDPSFAVAGDNVTVSGYFDGFDSSNLDHMLLIGTKPLSSLGIVPRLSDDRQSISFQLPGRDEIGTAYTFPVSITTGSENSTSIDFSFVSDSPPIVSIRVLGASFDKENEQYELGSCDPSEYIAELPIGISDPEVFEWSMAAVDNSRENILGQNEDVTNTSAKELRIPPTVFGGRTGTYIISVNCEVNGEILEDSVVVVKTQAPVIGVTLIAPGIRGIGSPNVAARVHAQIVTPPTSCYNRLSPVVYQWSFQGRTYVKKNITSSASREIEEPVVGLLGREFVLPQSSLSYGNHSVSLLAYLRDDPSVNGSAVSSFEIKPLGLVAVIGFGASFLVHDGNRNLQITSENTICPDCMVVGRRIISIYRWKCSWSTKRESSAQHTPCSMRFLPNSEAESFSVSSQALFRHRDLNKRDLASSGSKSFFLRYTLQVGAGSFLSDEATQIIEVRTEGEGVATLKGIDFYNNRGKSLYWLSLPFYEDILIVPRSADTVSWEFEMVSSSFGTNVLSDPEKLISLDGYYNSALNRSQQYPLGIKAYGLLPYESYTILLYLSSSTSSVTTSTVTLAVRTRDEPKLVLPDLIFGIGDTDDVFSAWASVNLDARHPFLFFFFAVENNGREQCLDGCSGSNTIQFRIPVAGKFRILVRLRNARGSAVLDEAYFPNALSISESPTTVSTISDLTTAAQFITELERTGDHGTIVLLTAMISSVQDSWVSLSLTDTEIVNFKKMVDALEEVVKNSVPSTSSSKNFVLAAIRLSSVRSEFISLTTFSSLLSIVDLAIKRVPAEELFDHEIELKAFYNISIGHALRLFMEATEIESFQSEKVEKENVRIVFAQVYRMLREQLITVLSRDALCGTVKKFNTILFDDDATIAVVGNQTVLTQVLRQVIGSYDFLGTYGAPWKPTHTSFSMAVTCFANELNELHGETVSLKWCGDSFSLGNVRLTTDFQLTRKLLFSLMETVDYQFLTGAVEQESDTLFISNYSVASLSARGIDEVLLPDIPTCFQLNMSIHRLGLTPYLGCLSAEGYSITMPTSTLSDNQSSTLLRNFENVETYVPDDQSSTILITSAITGTFGATATSCPANAKRPQVQTPMFNIEFGYLAFGGAMVGIVGMGISWVTSSSSYAALVGAAAAA